MLINRFSAPVKALKVYYSQLPRIEFTKLIAREDDVLKNAEERGVFGVNMCLLKNLWHQKKALSQQLNRLNLERKKCDPLQATKLREDVRRVEHEMQGIEEGLSEEGSKIPNWSSEHSPPGGENCVLRQCHMDIIEKSCNLNYADHMNMPFHKSLFDFESGVRVIGAHFPILKGLAASLELALLQWSMQKAMQSGFQLLAMPDLVKIGHIHGSGFQPRQRGKTLPIFTAQEDGDESFKMALAGTSEVGMVGMLADQVLTSNELPLKFVAWNHCFRSEVGHHTAASRGLYRLHQFTKVELFSAVDAERSAQAFEEITGLQAALLDELQLPYRVLEMSRRELGASAHRKWDHEVWMPGRRMWGEVMSASSCTDYQSRRLNIRYRSKSGKMAFAHTLNGTACAVPRMIMALIEWGWDPACLNTLSLPVALKPFLLLPPTDFNIQFR